MSAPAPVSASPINNSLNTADPSFGNSWQIENLIKLAFDRTRDRWLSYFLTLILSLALWLILVLIIGLAVLLLVVITSLTGSLVLAVALGVFAALSAVLAAVYLSSWVQLALTAVLVQKEKTGVMETFSRLRPWVWGFYSYTLFFSIFLFGLLPWGILSLGSIFILWNFWGSLAIFVYLEKGQKNLANLWYSRALINQRFWGIAGRLAVVFLAYYVIFFLLVSAGNGLGTVLSFVASWLFTPFFLSYLYEIYTHLGQPVGEPKKPTIWIILSVLGGLLIFISFVASFYLGSLNWDQLLQTYSDQRNLLPVPKVGNQLRGL